MQRVSGKAFQKLVFDDILGKKVWVLVLGGGKACGTVGWLGSTDGRTGQAGSEAALQGLGSQLLLCLALLEIAWSLGEEHSTPLVELWALKTG